MPEQDIVTFRFPPELTAQIHEIATREFESRSTIIRRLIRLGLADYQERPASAVSSPREYQGAAS